MLDFFKIQQYRIVNTFIFTYLSIFLFYAFKIKNTEFIGYIFLFFSIFLFINLFFEKYLRRFNLLYMFCAIFLLMHILGGIVYFADIRLYDHYFFDFFRYDWFMHLLGGLISGHIAYAIVKDNFLYRKNSYQLLIAIIIILALGIGVVNEIIEFMAVIFLNAGKAVGDYYNNLTDICNNFIGSIIYLLLFSKTHKFKDEDFIEFKKIKTGN